MKKNLMLILSILAVSTTAIVLSITEPYIIKPSTPEISFNECTCMGNVELPDNPTKPFYLEE